MINFKTLFTFSLMLIAFLFSNDIDVLNLKNGDLIKGTIVENKINDYIRIELQGGSILTYTYDQIESIEIEKIQDITLSSTKSTVNCYQVGRTKGMNAPGGGALLGGLAAGFLGGLIGTGIAYGVVSLSDPNVTTTDLPEPDQQCIRSFRNGYKEEALKVKKNNVLIGGGVGTLGAILFLSSLATN